MKNLTSLWSCIAHEMAIRCCTSATLDIKTVKSRTENEGLSFLAITLADYGKAIQKWLDHGLVVPWDAPSFKKDRLTGLPVFLRGFLGRVFCPVSGVLLDEPDIEAIIALRQLTLMYSKIALPEESFTGSSSRVVSPRRERRAMSDYVQCEQDVREADARLDPSYLDDFKRISSLLFGSMFSKVDRDIHFGRTVPKHGPGAVADRISSNAKFNLRTWTTRLDGIFPAEEFLLPNFSFREGFREELTVLEPGQELPVRVITVPKTLKTPRIIAIEPAAMQYSQQAILRCILDAVKEDGFLSRVIGFDDQDPNRILAHRGSLSGELATLDLSEASDRVSNQHVRIMLEDFPELLRAVDSARSRKADVPGHGVQRLAKFASMGSALCFPFEAMVFLTLIFMGIERESSSPLSRNACERYCEQVRVFGDDLIVPRDYVLSVVDELENFGFRVNVSKSYWTGRFRESCGREYFDGHDVSIVKVRQILPTRRQDASGVIAAVSLRNQLYWAGYWQAAAYLDSKLERILRFYPNVAPDSPLLGRESALGYQFQRLDPNAHSPLTKGYYVDAKPPRDSLDGAGALLKCLLRTAEANLPLGVCNSKPSIDVASVDDEHLERSGRPERVNIKLGWRSPF
ncbi:TPA_asm: RNA-directed RNA polymerase [ssRNA phage Zoerhiza.4_17]|uniref:RNA-directed RNA polymerase n=2 Tax=Leviviricetes TaxID=2842243 RepID=A0A8S5L1H6_9VIRU|nr:RNA-directed RNA polymerase [ssRNA phage Zoerhiza.4_17]QDH88779.1 MAG: RNA-dependent RNA polymerase [Leviviridae sp.]DAD51734.1 TPA_asm: RNA-directed RNA polymerase [ssRNA phage Zoerhiza.4_17]